MLVKTVIIIKKVGATIAKKRLSLILVIWPDLPAIVVYDLRLLVAFWLMRRMATPIKILTSNQQSLYYLLSALTVMIS